MQPERIDRVARGARIRVGTKEQWHLQPGGGVVTGEGQYADEQFGIVVETGVRRGELVADLRSERVLLLDAVDGHHEDSVVDDFGVHLPVSMSVHGGHLRFWFHDETDNRRLSYMMQPSALRWAT